MNLNGKRFIWIACVIWWLRLSTVPFAIYQKKSALR